ncbi:hypothetical protein INR49_001027 [Caranx melampygus]|nr:hypothetical protein INR49_001027 [Caranx melampygus]
MPSSQTVTLTLTYSIKPGLGGEVSWFAIGRDSLSLQDVLHCHWLSIKERRSVVVISGVRLFCLARSRTEKSKLNEDTDMLLSSLQTREPLGTDRPVEQPKKPAQEELRIGKLHNFSTVCGQIDLPLQPQLLPHGNG